MNYYAILPLIAFIANIILGCYIYYRNPKDKLNILFALFVFSVATWAFGDFLVLTSSTVEEALSLNRVGTAGSSLMSIFLLHFFLIFTKNRFLSKKIRHIPLISFVYLPPLFFLFVGITTNLITENLAAPDIGYVPIYGPLYNVFTVCVTVYTITSLLICYNFYKGITSKTEKKQVRIVFFAVFIPTTVGVISQVVPPFFGLQTIRLTTTITAIMAVLIAYAVFRYRLMAPMSFSIQRKIAVFTIILILSTCLFSILIGSYYFRDSMEDDIKNHLSSNSEIYNKYIEDFLEHQKRMVEEVLSTDYQIIELLSISSEAVDYKDKYNVVKRELNHFLHDKFYELFILDADGVILLSTDEKNVGLDKSEDEYFLQGKEGLHIKDVYYSETTKKNSIVISSSILDIETKELLGVVAARTDISMIDEISNDRTGLGETGELLLARRDENGDAVFFTTRRFETDSSAERMIIKEQTNVPITQALLKNEGIFENVVDYRGVSVLASTQYIEITDWGLVAKIDTEEAFAPVVNMQRIMVLLFVIVVVCSIILSYIFAKSISKPIIKLKYAADEIGEGKLDTKIDIESNDEIGGLADAFTDMTKNLKEQQDNLENQVLERTRELDTKIEELQRFKKVTVDRELKMRELKKKIKELEGGAKK